MRLTSNTLEAAGGMLPRMEIALMTSVWVVAMVNALVGVAFRHDIRVVKGTNLRFAVINVVAGCLNYVFAHPGRAAGCAAVAAFMLWLWWTSGGDDDFRRRRRRAVAALKSKLRSFAPSPIPSPA